MVKMRAMDVAGREVEDNSYMDDGWLIVEYQREPPT